MRSHRTEPDRDGEEAVVSGYPGDRGDDLVGRGVDPEQLECVAGSDPHAAEPRCQLWLSLGA